jgi:hypothetical protein
MAHVSLKTIIAEAAKATPQKFEDWQKQWRLAAANGSQDTLLDFVSREAGLSEVHQGRLPILRRSHRMTRTARCKSP